MRRDVKHQILAGMDKSNLVLLKFTKETAQTALHWEHSAEFEYEEQMYDIVESWTQGDSVFYWCWPDHAETAINEHLDKLIEQVMLVNLTHEQDQRQKNQKQTIDFLKTFYHDQQRVSHYLSYQHALKPGIQSLKPYLNFDFPPPSPPPEIA